MSFRSPPDAGFFVGYFKKVPTALQRFAITVGVAAVVGFAVLAVTLSFATDDPGNGGYAFDGNDIPLEGVMELRPYPVVHLPATATRPAHAVMLAGQDKEGVQEEIGRASCRERV